MVKLTTNLSSEPKNSHLTQNSSLRRRSDRRRIPATDSGNIYRSLSVKGGSGASWHEDSNGGGGTFRNVMVCQKMDRKSPDLPQAFDFSGGFWPWFLGWEGWPRRDKANPYLLRQNWAPVRLGGRQNHWIFTWFYREGEEVMAASCSGGGEPVGGLLVDGRVARRRKENGLWCG